METVSIGGYIPTGFLDYPGAAAAVIFLKGCPFRCPFCHNPGLVLPGTGGESFEPDEIIGDLERRKNFLDGVCITGGEPSIQEGLVPFLGELRSLDLKVKLDTNGARPDVLEEVLGRGLAEYVAMDIKAPREKYSLASGWDGDLSLVEKSISLLLRSKIPFEFRTTLVPGIHGLEDAPGIGDLVRGAPLYVLQRFRPGLTLDPAFAETPPLPVWFAEAFRERVLLFADEVRIRG
ncbi:pyruvate formate lyase activating enzyme [Aminivibrio pyruvatiphilus]|uniref:Pyruvate formate lyase activating enzyme n=2 Tax=Aminivibrio pyruvatiphilus TaxID=1005740 RepID=A0A4R8MGB1_9BACT|nr:pyruvate formate lyase activating enzyme [Aminivibrio pyruvatiphilus]